MLAEAEVGEHEVPVKGMDAWKNATPEGNLNQ